MWIGGKTVGGGRYIIEDVLGGGGFGVTYKAKHTGFGTYVVIKTPRDDLQYEADYDKFVQRFLKEGQLLAKLAQKRHPHIVRVTDLFREGDIDCLVMEYIEGESLWKRLKQTKQPLSEAEALKYFRQIGDALSVVHQEGLAHRDAHPDNIMLTGDGLAVLIDFGIAGEFVPATTFSRRFGNAVFAPLEQFELGNDNRKPTIDIYTLAASLYYAVTAQCPQWQNDELIPPQQFNPKICDKVNQAILEGMKLEAINRPQSMQEWLQLLAETGEPKIDWRRYGKLRDLLAAGKWKEADEETGRLMLMVAGREKEGWLDVEHIDNFPCEDLRAIDHLWVKYSNGRFGFSVQKRIYQSLGGTRKYDEKIWEAFGDRVGWRKNGKWLYYHELIFNTNAPLAHLPVWRRRGYLGFGSLLGVGLGFWGSLLSRRDL
ncbi:GUN4 domain-containing protein [Aerosakkonema sp. BLCC-F183]|uniref:GUN4 domain-containing protein n=1 Tax=Aerosakkonema sp. BLCC-F183 TaxID=3342834 RepID=UPI0035BA05E2